jgi:DNA polymerase III psi subunit
MFAFHALFCFYDKMSRRNSKFCEILKSLELHHKMKSVLIFYEIFHLHIHILSWHKVLREKIKQNAKNIYCRKRQFSSFNSFNRK